MAERLFFKFKVSEQMRKKKCRHDVRLAVAKKMSEWRNVVPYLLPENEEVENEISQDIRYGEKEKRNRLLERWIEICGLDATHEKLICAFVAAERIDLAEIVCEKIGEFVDCMYRIAPNFRGA